MLAASIEPTSPAGVAVTLIFTEAVASTPLFVAFTVTRN